MSAKAFSPGCNSATIYRETSRQLENFIGLAREGKSLEEGLKFARFVIWSGIPELLEENYCADKIFLADGAALRSRANVLQTMAQDWFVNRKQFPKIPLSEIESINAKLDRLLHTQGIAYSVPSVLEVVK